LAKRHLDDLVIERALDARLETAPDRAADMKPGVGIIGVTAEEKRVIAPREHQIVGVEAKDQLARRPLAFALHLDRAKGRILDRDRKLLGGGDENISPV